MAEKPRRDGPFVETKDAQYQAAKDDVMVTLLRLEDQHGTRIVAEACAEFIEFAKTRPVRNVRNI